MRRQRRCAGGFRRGWWRSRWWRSSQTKKRRVATPPSPISFREAELEGHVGADTDRSGVRRPVVAVVGVVVVLIVPEVGDFALEPDARAELVGALQRHGLVLVAAAIVLEVAVRTFEADRPGIDRVGPARRYDIRIVALSDGHPRRNAANQAVSVAG